MWPVWQDIICLISVRWQPSCTWFVVVQRFDEAAHAFYCGVKIDPNNKELIEAFKYVWEFCLQFFIVSSYLLNVHDVQIKLS
jgi:hypothetical protein